MDKRGLLYFPRWVYPKKLILGDLSFRRDIIGSPWNKFIYNGSKWLPYDVAPENIKIKMRVRQKAQEHNRQVRQTGV